MAIRRPLFSNKKKGNCYCNDILKTEVNNLYGLKCKVFKHKGDLYTIPLRSSSLNIFRVRTLSNDVYLISSDFLSKYILLPDFISKFSLCAFHFVVWNISFEFF